MAQKSSPYAIRVGYNQIWNNYFFPTNKQEKIGWLLRNKKIRDYFSTNFANVTRLRIEYTKSCLFIYLYLPEQSIAGEKNKNKLDNVLKDLRKLINEKESNFTIKVNLIEVKNVYLHAQGIADTIAEELKNRVSSRIVIRRVLSKASFEKENKWVNIQIKGRLDGSEIAQTRKFSQGKMPLSTIDSEIDVGRAKVITTYGAIGIKVLLYKGKYRKKRKYVNSEKN